MKLTLNKDHLNHKSGDEIEVTDQQAEYFKRMGIVKEKVLHVDGNAVVADKLKHTKANK